MEGTVITKKGIQLLAKVISSKDTMNITRAAVGTGTIMKGYDPASMIELVEYKMDAVISECTASGDIAEITMQVSSEGIETGFIITEIGVFANDPDEGEILYSYIDLSNDAQYIYPEGGEAIKFVEITLDIVIVEGTKVTAFINPLSMVKRQEFEEHTNNFENPHKITPKIIGLGNVDNTADAEKPVSTAQQTALDAYYQQSTGYTDTKIAQLINGAPSTLDTLGEIAEAMKENEGVVGALEAAIGSKANEAELASHVKDTVKHITAAERAKWDGKMEATGDSANNTVTFSSGDAAEAISWTDIERVASGEKHSSLFRKVSLAIKNLRYLWKVLGTTSLKGIGDGTVTGAINELNTGLSNITSDENVINGVNGVSTYRSSFCVKNAQVKQLFFHIIVNSSANKWVTIANFINIKYLPAVNYYVEISIGGIGALIMIRYDGQINLMSYADITNVPMYFTATYI